MIALISHYLDGRLLFLYNVSHLSAGSRSSASPRLPPTPAMTSTPDLPPLTIPVLLLKTRSHPHDAYEEYFGGRSAPTNIANSGQQLTSSIPVFLPEFVPVLEHRRNVENLETLERLLGSGELGNRYGGMIFTSQRAVEAWAEVVKRVERVEDDGEHLRPSVAAAASQDLRSGMVHPKVRFPPPLVSSHTDDAQKTLTLEHW